MRTLKLAIVAAILTLGFNIANAQVHIGVNFGYPARAVYYHHPYYRPVVVERPVYYEPARVVVRRAYPVYYRHRYVSYRRPIIHHRIVYHRW